MHRVDRGLDLVRARLVAREQGADEGVPFRDQRRVPQRAILVRQQHDRAVRRSARAAPRFGEHEQREQPEHLCLVRHQLGEQSGEPDRLGAQIVARQRIATARRVSLVVDQVDDGEYGSEPIGELRVFRDAIRDVGGANLPLRAYEALCHRRLRHEKRPGDLGRLEPADQTQGQSDLRTGRERRVAAGEDQPELIVGHGLAIGVDRLLFRAEHGRLDVAVVP